MTTAVFWLEAPAVLFSSTKVLPTADMSKEERLNTITRLLLVVAAILFFAVPSRIWLTVLVTGLAVILTLYLFHVKKREGFDTVSRQRRPLYGRKATPDTAPPAPPAPLIAIRTRAAGLVGEPTRTLPHTQPRLQPLGAPPTLFRKR